MESHQMHLFEIYFQSPYNIGDPQLRVERHTRPCLWEPWQPGGLPPAKLPAAALIWPWLLSLISQEREAQTHRNGSWGWSPALWIPSPISVCSCMLSQHKTESDKVIQDLEVVGFLTQKEAPASFSRTFLSTVASAAPANQINFLTGGRDGSESAALDLLQPLGKLVY